MSYLPTLTQLQKDVLLTSESVLRQGALLNAFAAEMTTAHQAFWGRDPQRILDELNSDVTRYTDLIVGKDTISMAVNEQLTKLNRPEYPSLCPIGFPPEFTFVDGQFVYTPPPQPENPLDVEP